jgi:transmembrane sensor
MAKPDFQKALKEAATGLDQGLPDAAERRIRARLNGEPAKGRAVRWSRVGAMGFAAALAATLALFVVRPAEPRVETLGGFALVSPSADFQASAAEDGTIEVRQGRCVLKDERLGATLSVSGSARLARLADGVQVAAGVVDLDVDHNVARAAPYQVRVSHGVIEVLGTQFTVTARDGGGQVKLNRGSIRFRATDGRVELLSPGQTLSWPLPEVAVAPVPEPVKVEPAPPIKKPAPVAARTPEPEPTVEPVAPPLPAFDPEELLNRIAVLRSRGQYEEAIATLRRELGQEHPAATRERLSYELGAILTVQLNDKPRGCAHWTQHLGQFPQGRYDREVSQARAKLECGDTP